MTRIGVFAQHLGDVSMKTIVNQQGQMTRSFLALVMATLLIAISFVSVNAHAEVKKTLGDWEVHYIALTTTFLTPEIARANNIVRSGKNALVNISVLDGRSKKAQVVEMTGTARNLLGTVKQLDFKQVKEGDAIYYLASVPFAHKEVLRFDIDIKQGRVNQNLQFQQTMYVED
jgi:hypothetical protein